MYRLWPWMTAPRSAASDRGYRPSFLVFLAALVLLPFKWLSPFSYAQAGWSDILFAVAAVIWLGEALRERRRIRLRAPHYAYATYALTVTLAALLSSESGRTAGQNVLITIELVGLAILTAHYASAAAQRRAIARAVLVVVAITAIEAALGLILFYLGHSTSLVTGYSSYFKSSSVYTRVQAGFYSPPLLGNFTIFASAVIDMADAQLSRRVRLTAQTVLGLLALATISRPLIGFIAALGVRNALRRLNRRGGRRLAALVVVTSLIVAVGLTVAPLSLDPLRPGSSAAGINPRLAMIKTASTTFAHHVLVGAGPGSLVARWQGSPLRAHLTPLNIAATTGLLSLLALVSLALILWRGRRRPTDLILWSGLLGLGIDALTQDVEHFRQVWLMLGLIDAERSAAG